MPWNYGAHNCKNPYDVNRNSDEKRTPPSRMDSAGSQPNDEEMRRSPCFSQFLLNQIREGKNSDEKLSPGKII